MITLYTILGFVLMATALTVFITAGIHDLRKVQASRRKVHFRRMPLVSIVIDDTTTDTSLASVRKGNYRKYEIIYASETMRGDVLLTLKHDTTLDSTAIRRSVQQLYRLEDSHFIEIKPVLQIPTDLSHFFQLYRRISTAPFISVRAQLAVRPLGAAKWPIIQQPHLKDNWQTYAYYAVAWLLSLANAATLVLLAYYALWLSQPILLLLYIGTFWIWMIVSIWDYPHFSMKQKIAYTVLAPASFGYFIVLALIGPLNVLMRAVPRVLAKYFARSAHQSVV